MDEARFQCVADNSDFSLEKGFLTLPRPKNLAENNLYFNTFWQSSVRKTGDRYWLDISEEEPATDPRRWVYGDKTPVSWTNWKKDEPNDHGEGEPYVEVDPDEFWNDVSKETFRNFMCVHYLPAGAEETCPWLADYTD